MTSPRRTLFPLVLVSVCLFITYTVLFGAPEPLTRITKSVTLTKVWPSSPSPSTTITTTTTGTTGQDELNLPGLQALCNRTSWNPNLSIHCHSRCGRNETSFCGGLNNARDRLQTCVRLGVDAGAITVIIPSLAARSEKRLGTVNPAAIAGAEDEVVELCADAWFGLERLQAALRANCPQLQLRAVCPAGTDTVDHVSATAAAVVKTPWRPMGGRIFDTEVGHTFREAVGDILGSTATTSDTPTIVEFGDPYGAWDYRRSAEQTTIFKELFRAVGYNPDLLALGRRIAQSPRLRPRDEPYIGVHLRGENDWPPEWGSLEDQTRLYAADMVALRELETSRGVVGVPPPAPVRNVYVSCGNRSAIRYFREVVEPLGYTVLDKWTLLETDWPEGLAVVEALPFDQKAIVEYEPLVGSKYFLGLSMSSMSFVVVMARTLDEPGDFYAEYIENDKEGAVPSGTMTVRGNNHTRLLVASDVGNG